MTRVVRCRAMILAGAALILGCARSDTPTALPLPVVVDLTGRWTGTLTVNSLALVLSQTGDTVSGSGLDVYTLIVDGMALRDSFPLEVAGRVRGTAVELTYWPEGLPQLAHVLVGQVRGSTISGRDSVLFGSGSLPLTLGRQP